MTKTPTELRRYAGDELERSHSADRSVARDAPSEGSSVRRSALARFLLLYVVMYAAYGVASPFFPAFLVDRGIGAGQLGLVLGASTAVRLISAPLAARAGEALHRVRGVLVMSVLATTVVTLGLLPVHGFWLLLLLALLQAATMAPINVLADALTLGHARSRRGADGFEYGWVRGAGSAAFVGGMLLAGHAVSAFGLAATIRLQVGLLAVATLCACFIPEAVRRAKPSARTSRPREHLSGLLRSKPFRRLVLVAALLIGSHALNDAFAILRWTTAGIAPQIASLLWAESVISEVLVFLAAGPALVSWLSPAGAIALATGAGIVRWAVSALTLDVTLLALIQPLHGLTFALFHLSVVRLVARIAPPRLEATALAIYATAGGAATALVTLLAGVLYAWIGGAAFWVMVALCALALLASSPLRERALRRAAPPDVGAVQPPAVVTTLRPRRGADRATTTADGARAIANRRA